MDIDACHDSQESKLGFVTDTHVLKVVIVQHMIIDSFSRSPVFIDLLPFIRSV